MSFFIYFFSFVLTYVGFLLGKSTKEEHEEIQKTALLYSQLLKIVYFIMLFLLFYKNLLLEFVLITIFGFEIMSEYAKNKDFTRFVDILLFSVSLILFLNYRMEFIAMFIILIFIMIIKNSFHNFVLKEEIYSIIIYLLFYVIYVVIRYFLE